MASTPAPRRTKARSDLIHLRSLPSMPPDSATGKVAWAWSEIEACLASGMRMREVWEAATADNLEIPYAQFRVYVSRLRRRKQFLNVPLRRQVSAEAPESSNSSADPLRNLREQREKKKQVGFDYDPFSIHRDLID